MSAASSAGDPLLQLLGGKVRAQAVSTAAHLGLADVLRDGPLSLAELTLRLECESRPLESLLMFLVGLGLLTQPAPDRFETTELGRRLCSDDLGPLAAFIGAPEQWDPWSRLRDSVRAGPCAFERTHARGLYSFLAREPAAARRYDAAIEAFTRHEARALCEQYDFGVARRIVDVGGGRGALLEELLSRWPHLTGTSFDLPHVARDSDHGSGPARRAHVASGDFLHAVPEGADHYLLKHVLHNWSDEDCLRILRNCARASVAGGRVLVVEAVLAPDGRLDTAAQLDLEMLVLTGGRVRRKPELRRLLQSSGMRLDSMQVLTDAAWLCVLAV